MIEYAGMARLALAVAAVAGLVLTLRGLGDREGPSLAELFRIPVDPPLPRGLSEEEPLPWRLERLSRPRSAEQRVSSADAPRQAVDGSPQARVPLSD